MPPGGIHFRFDGPHAQFALHDADEVHCAWTADHAWEILARADRALAAGLGVAGFVSYEFGYACAAVDRPRRAALAAPAVPLLLFAFFRPDRIRPLPAAEASEAAAQLTSAFTASVAFADYAARIADIHGVLHAGDAYQINYTVPFEFTYKGDPFGLYRRLATVSQAPEQAFFAFEHFAVAALSPELFLEFAGNRLITRPMKGTAPAGHEAALDSPKNRAEHVMIVDLLRNDLGRIGDDVRVDALFTRERYPTFSTVTSTISARRRAGVGFADIFRAMFPCGSITGAPKYAAMEHIARLERADRGAYCGSLGYVLPNGQGRWNVAIRTLQFDQSRGCGRLDLGGGIVADSDAAAEWAEIALKGQLFSPLAPLAARNSA